MITEQVKNLFFFRIFLIKETYEEKNRLLKERLDRIFSGNERRCSRAPMYGRDLLSVCSVSGAGSPGAGSWGWAGSVHCGLSARAPVGARSPLQEMILTLLRQQESLKDVVNR